jgi:hypothetical protein
MHAKSLVCAAALAALLANVAAAQYGGGYPGTIGDASPYAMTAYQPAEEMPSVMAGGPACGAGVSCGDGCGGCGGGCGGCCQGWCHRVNVFGEFLYLRARNAEVAYAVPIDGGLLPGDPVIQTGPVEVVDPDGQAGFRIGAGFTLDECSQIVATYSYINSTTTDAVTLPGTGDVLRSLVSSPINIATDGLDAAAALDIQFDLIDLDYKGLFAFCDDYKLNYLVGVRYASLDQDFASISATNGIAGVVSDVEFEGVGLRLGLEGERYGRNRQWFVYGKSAVSFIGGEFRTAYQSFDQGDALITDTSWRSGRIVTITDLEVGVGWRNHCDNFRVSLGYMYSFWHNTVMTREWINAVQENNFVDPSDNFEGLLTFDGLTIRAEVLW